MGRCTSMDVDPTPCTQVLPDAVPVPRARDHLAGSGPSPRPGHREAGALGRGHHDLWRGRELLAVHPRASQGAARARGRRVRQGGLAITRADPRALTAVFATKPRGRAGAVAGIPHQDELARWKPAPQAGHQQPGERRRRAMARPRCLIPFWATIPGDPNRERPGPDRQRQLDQPRPHAPLMPPPLRRITGGRAHAIPRPSLAEDVGARTFCNRVIASQEHRARRDDLVQEQRDQQASQRPDWPSAW
jgi:hypothetical protein